MAILKPSPSSPIRFAAGTRTSCSANADVSVARWPLLSRCFSIVTPGVSMGTMKADIPVAPGRRLHRRDVRARAGLREPERAEDRLLEERRQPLLLLLVAAGEDHGAGAEAVRGDRGADAGAAPVELLADEHAVERAEPRSAVLLGDVEVHQAEGVRLLDHVGGVLHPLVVGGLLRPDLVRRELVRELAERLLLVREGKRDARRLDRRHDLLGSR